MESFQSSRVLSLCGLMGIKNPTALTYSILRFFLPFSRPLLRPAHLWFGLISVGILRITAEVGGVDPCHHLHRHAFYFDAFSSFSIITALNCEQLLIELEGRTATQATRCGNVVKRREGFHVARQR